MPNSSVALAPLPVIGRICFALLLLGGALSAAPSWAFNDDTEKAVSDYLNVTLPTIAKLAPLIDAPAADREKAFAAMGIKDNACESGVADAFSARERLAEGGGNVCSALIAWMHDEDIYTCSRVGFSGIDFAKTDPTDTRIAARHKADNVVATRLHLDKAANCTGKTLAYWGARTLGLYTQLAFAISKNGELVPPSNDAAAPTAEAFRNTMFLCHLSFTLGEKTRSGVVGAANDGCYAMNSVLRREPLQACKTLKTAIDKSASMGASDPFSSEASGLALKLNKQFAALECSDRIAAVEVAEAKAAQASQPPPNPNEKRDALIQTIKDETHWIGENMEVAERWTDRGNDREACDYYRKSMTSWGNLEKAYADLARETGNSDYTADSSEMKTHRLDLFNAVNDRCKEAGNRLYY